MQVGISSGYWALFPFFVCTAQKGPRYKGNEIIAKCELNVNQTKV